MKISTQFGNLSRLLFVVLLFPFLFFTGIGREATEDDEMRNVFFMAAVPSIMVMLLISVLFRGSLGQKITALILLFPAAGLGFIGWAAAIDFIYGH